MIIKKEDKILFFYFNTFISFPTFSNISTALSNCSLVCPAVTIHLNLPVPLGTVGNTIAETNTPFSSNFLLNSIVLASSPMITGVIGVWLFPILNPNWLIFSLKYFALSQSLSVYSVVLISILIASMIAPTAAGGRDVLNSKGLPLWLNQSLMV